MIYEPNQIIWKVGDIVIHDCDGKIPDMLMVVTGHDNHGDCETVYLERNRTNGEIGRKKKRVWVNDPKVLHAPARFGIALPNAQAEGRGSKTLTNTNYERKQQIFP